MNIYTIGFSQKSEKKFFKLLTDASVKTLIDIRLNNTSQLAGFANAKHLPYFLKLHNIDYLYTPQFAPTEDLFKGYKKGTITWDELAQQYRDIIESRNALQEFDLSRFADSALLCSEPTAKHCHRRILAEMIAQLQEDATITHL